MVIPSLPLRGVVCDDRPLVRRMAVALLRRCGFAVAGEAEDAAGLHGLVRDSRADVAVLALPVAGLAGLSAVRVLRDVAPGCEVILLSAFEQLEPAALEAGAWGLVAEDDPQALRRALLQIAALHQAGQPVTPAPPQRVASPADTVVPAEPVAARSPGSVSTNAPS